MGLTIKNKTSYQLGNNLTEFFSVPLEEPIQNDEYRRLKDDIYKLDIDIEEKADIINKINSLNQEQNAVKKKKLLKEIETFCNEYDI